jgi:hypothetical protein
MITWGRLTDLINRGKGLDTTSALFFAFSKDHVQLFAIELNTGGPNNSENGQLFLQGLDAEGVQLSKTGGDYAPMTKDLKRFQGLPFDRVTLYEDGDFYRSWEFMQKGDSFTLKADTMKDGEDLQTRWGSNIIGLTDESITKLSSEVLPEIIQYIRRQLLQGR